MMRIQGKRTDTRVGQGSSWIVLSLCALSAADSTADTGHPSSMVVVVDEAGGAFDVAVHPDYMTIVYLPGSDIEVMNADEALFPSVIVDSSVIIRPEPEVPGDARGNLGVTVGEMKLNVMLTVAESPDTARGQVFVKKRTEVERFEARVKAEVSRRYAAAKAYFERRQRGLDREVMRRTEAIIAERLLGRHKQVRIGRRERNDDNVIVHVERGVWVGDELYLFVEIQNRSGRPYRLAKVAVTGGDGRDRAGIARFGSGVAPDDGIIGMVPARKRGRGIVRVRGAEQMKGQSLALAIREVGGGRAVKVAGIRW